MIEPKSLLILGRQPALGLAELESLYGAEHVQPVGNHALLDIPAEEINFKRLGGIIKTAQILKVLDRSGYEPAISYLKETVPKYAPSENKLDLGVSLYGLEVNLKKLTADLLSIKKAGKNMSKSIRIVPNKSLGLSSAQVMHNKLTRKGGWEIIVLSAGTKTYIAQTLFVQDIEAYAARDQARPARDARIGMLPPKLAQIILNLAIGPLERKVIMELRVKRAQTSSKIRLLDPFCGTGVILQEALLAGCSVVGTDIQERMVEYSQTNIKWLIKKYPAIEGQVDIELADATNYRWPRFSAVATETYLGRPLVHLPAPDKLQQIISDTNTVIKKFLSNLASQLKPGQRLCMAVPAWRRPNGEFLNLPCLAKLTEMGYNYVDLKHVSRRELIYFREGQSVARQLIILEKI